MKHYYDIKQIKPNKVYNIQLSPRKSGKNYARQKRGRR